VVSRAQALEAGVTDRAIERRLQNGKLQRVHRGVYAVGYRSASPLTRAMAAVLACRPGAALSHRSAAALWELGVAWGDAVEVTAAVEHRCDGVIAHQSRSLTAEHITVRAGIPVTTVARTLIDLADVLADRALARAVNEAQVRYRVQLDALLKDAPGRRGAARLRAILERSAGAPTRSALEDMFLALIDRAALARPEVNQRVAGYEVDMLWRRQRLIVELDGRRFHDHPRAFERDRERDADLAAAGFTVVRVTWQRLLRQPLREAQRLRALLARARADDRGE
jgi:very-short-patch-repair endonuclease